MLTIEEAIKAMKEFQKKKNATDEEMLAVLYAMFQEDKITFDELDALVDSIGYELTEEFRNMSYEDQKTKGWEE